MVAQYTVLLLNYTVGHKNGPLYFGPKIPRFLIEFTLLVSMERGMLYSNFTLTVSLHYLMETKKHGTVTF